MRLLFLFLIFYIFSTKALPSKCDISHQVATFPMIGHVLDHRTKSICGSFVSINPQGFFAHQDLFSQDQEKASKTLVLGSEYLFEVLRSAGGWGDRPGAESFYGFAMPGWSVVNQNFAASFYISHFSQVVLSIGRYEVEALASRSSVLRPSVKYYSMGVKNLFPPAGRVTVSEVEARYEKWFPRNLAMSESDATRWNLDRLLEQLKSFASIAEVNGAKGYLFLEPLWAGASQAEEKAYKAIEKQIMRLKGGLEILRISPKNATKSFRLGSATKAQSQAVLKDLTKRLK